MVYAYNYYLLFSVVEVSSGKDDNVVIIATLAIITGLAVFGLIITVTVVIVVQHKKQSRCVVTSIHCM